MIRWNQPALMYLLFRSSCYIFLIHFSSAPKIAGKQLQYACENGIVLTMSQTQSETSLTVNPHILGSLSAQAHGMQAFNEICQLFPINSAVRAALLHGAIWQYIATSSATDSASLLISIRLHAALACIDSALVINFQLSHGIGHGFLYLAMREHVTNFSYSPCTLTPNTATANAVAVAEGYCALEQYQEFRYTCAEGLYHSIHNSRSLRPNQCKNAFFACFCLRFTAPKENYMNNDMLLSSARFCQAIGSWHAAATKRACIYGLATKGLFGFEVQNNIINLSSALVVEHGGERFCALLGAEDVVDQVACVSGLMWNLVISHSGS